MTIQTKYNIGDWVKFNFDGDIREGKIIIAMFDGEYVDYTILLKPPRKSFHASNTVGENHIICVIKEDE